MSGWILILLLVAAIIFIVIGTAKWRIHPFLILLVTAYALGLLAGLGPAETIEAIIAGFGDTLGGIGIIIAAGTIIGIVLERTGGARVMADAVIGLVGKARSAMAMSLTGAVVSIPVFFDSGFVIMSPLARSLASKANKSMATYALCLSSGLLCTHVFVPPTPGPIAGAQELGADIGMVIILGIVVTIPVLIATYIYAMTIGEKTFIDPDQVSIDDSKSADAAEAVEGKPAQPTIFAAFLPILLPILLIAVASVAVLDARPFGEGIFASTLEFIGDPNTALIIGVFLAFFVTANHAGEQITQDAVQRALRVAGPIILITGAGGALGGVLQATPITDFLGENLALTSMGLFLPFLLSAAIKTAQGSSTVAIITTAAIIAPLTGALGLESNIDLALATLAIGAGSVMVCHANDSGFWVVTQFSGMSVSQGYKLYTVMTAIAGLVGIASIFVLSLIL